MTVEAERFAALAAASGQIVWALTPNGVVEDAPTWRAFTGQTFEQMTGWGWLDAVHPEDKKALTKIWAEASAHASAFTSEYRVRRHDGVYRHLLVRGIPLAGADGQAREWIGTSTDITERKEAEEELRRAHAEVATILESITDAFFALDAEWRFTYVNNEAERLMRRKRQDLLGQRLLDVFPQMAGSAFERDCRQATSDWMAVGFEYHDVETDTWSEVSAYPAQDGGGLLVYFRDVTERKRAEDERARLEQRTHASLAALLAMAEALVQAPATDTPQEEGEPADPARESPRPGIGALGRRLAELTREVLGCDRVLMLAVEEPDRRLRPLAGVTRRGYDDQMVRETMAGARLDEYMAPEQVTRLLAGESMLTDVSRWVAAGRPAYGARQVLVAPMRVGADLMGVLTVDHVSQEHVYSSGEIALAGAVAKLAALVLERERLLREREEARASAAVLRETNRRLDEFLDLTSHELGAPLTVVNATVQLLAQRVSAGTPEGVLVDRTLRHVRRMRRMVKELLDVTRAQAGRLDLHRSSHDLIGLVRETVEELRHVEPGREIRLSLPDGVPEARVLADADRIGQVLANYLTNALKYAPASEPVDVGLAVADGAARVWVRDKGPGLPPEQHARVWERLHRAPGVTVQNGPASGLGLGLYIAREIVTGHGGQVGVESVPGQGATFWFSLPLRCTEA